MEDIDLLIPKERLEEAGELLRELGFEQVPRAPEDFIRGNTRLDVDTGFWYLDREGEAALWERAIVLNGSGSRIRVPSWEDHFVLAVAHSAVHHACWVPEHREDLRRMLKLPLDWGAVAERLRAYRLEAAAAASLRVLELDAPPDLARDLRLGNRPGLEECLYLRILERGCPSGVGHLLRLWTSPNRLGSLVAWVFPGKEFLRRRYDTRWPAVFVGLRPLLLLASACKALFSIVPGWRACAPNAEPPAGTPERAATPRR